MSKIQEALGRLRSRGGIPSGDTGRQSDSEETALPQSGQLGRPQLELDDTGELIRPNDGGYVEIDASALRNEGYLAPRDQERRLADQYRIIKRPLLDNALGASAHQSADSNLIMVTSALPGDGKTFNCINLAMSIALEKDISVLLVDADLPKPHVSNLFGVAEHQGLTDILLDETRDVSSFIMRTSVPGLSLLPAGKPHEHATELLASRRMTSLVARLSKASARQIVVFDSPPLLVTSESRVLAKSVGQIAMVVKEGVTPRHAVLSAIDSLDEEKAINLILNNSMGDSSSSVYGYGYGYGHGYGYGYKSGSRE